MSAVDYNNQTDSMRCKEHITSSNFILTQFGKKSEEPLPIKKENVGLFG